MIGRLQRSADFQRLLAAPMCARSAHFAVHHLSARPTLVGKKPSAPTVHPESTDLSTEQAEDRDVIVDKTWGLELQGHWLGSVIPKRHARRAVTRNLLRRQIRAVVRAQCAALAPGLWLVRLRAPLARSTFPSAASAALRKAMRAELQALFVRAAAHRPAAAR